jgi:hypothetical protein
VRAVDYRAQSAVESESTDPIRATPHVSDFLLPVSMMLWAFGISRTNATRIGPYGLPAVLPVAFYVGIALLVLSTSIELARSAPSKARMAIHVTALVIMLYGTAPLVYPVGRYAWLYKTVGVVQYVSSHGQLARQIDIYQNWPGFFAFAAWFDKVAGVASPLAYAKWAQLAFELAALPLLYLAYSALSLPERQRWIAIFLYSASNWIGQDYFSPQALGTILSLGILAIALRYMYVPNSSGSRRSSSSRHHRRPLQRRALLDLHNLRNLAGPLVLLVLIYFVLTATHQLSPYIVACQLAVLAAAGLLRPRWLPIALVAIAAGYLLPRYAFVNSHFGLLSSLGSFFHNLRPPPAAGAGPIPASERILNYCADALSIGLWLLALVGAWMRRGSRRTVLALLALAFAPILVLGLQAYGNEGILRVYLFALPWIAALAAAALAPVKTFLRSVRQSRRSAQSAAQPASPRAIATSGRLRIPIALCVTSALFFPAFFGGDSYVTMSTSEVDIVTSFLQAAPAGPVFVANDNAPVSDTARYNEFPLVDIFGSHGVVTTVTVPPDIAHIIAQVAEAYNGGAEPAYVLVTPSMRAYNWAQSITQASNFTRLLDALAHSPDWHKVLDDDGTTIYEMPPHLFLLTPQPVKNVPYFWIP